MRPPSLLAALLAAERPSKHTHHVRHVTPGEYSPTDPEATVLHTVLREHLATFLQTARDESDGRGLPSFVEHELRAYLRCRVLAHG